LQKFKKTMSEFAKYYSPLPSSVTHLILANTKGWGIVNIDTLFKISNINLRLNIN
jgi:hypothetical protein